MKAKTSAGASTAGRKRNNGDVVKKTYKYPEYQRKYQREYRAKRLVRIIAHLGGSCVVCGTINDLEIHHKDPSQKGFDPGSRIRAWPIVLAELEKCELRCVECHQDAHGRSQHGTQRMYQIYKCRCYICVISMRGRQSGYQGTEEYKAWARDYKRNRYQNDPVYRADVLRKQREYRQERS
jgi:hypothetical protein